MASLMMATSAEFGRDESNMKELFTIKLPLTAEMNNFREIMSSQPETGRDIFRAGETLVSFAESGQFRRFCEAAQSLSKDELFPRAYFYSKAFQAALAHVHLMMGSYMLDRGYPLNSNPGLPNPLIRCIKDETISDEATATIVQFLASKGFDINKQVYPIYPIYTPPISPPPGPDLAADHARRSDSPTD